MSDVTPTITLHPGDNRESLRRLIDQGVQVHSVVCDPPYGLVSVTKRFGKSGAAAAKSNGATGVFKRASGGFMGQEWDASGIERDPEFWRLIYDILLPGGYVLAFSSPRTGHWQACAMEMAGFVMHPFFGWVYGSGFPKAHNAAMAIDRELGVESEVVGYEKFRDIRNGQGRSHGEGIHASAREGKPVEYIQHPKRKGGSPEAQQWEGWAYGAQSLKPALEPVYFAQKPFSEKNGALNLLKHGVGAVNIDGCRVAPTGERLGGGAEKITTAEQKGNEGWTRPWMSDEDAQQAHAARVRDNVDRAQTLGRHPANLIHDDSEEAKSQFPNDSARFFNGFPFEADPLFYHAKASKADRAGSKHPTVKPVPLMQHFVRLVTPPGGVVLDPFGGSGTTGEAARREGFDCILMEADERFIADIRNRFGLPVPAEDGFDDLFDSDDSFDAMFT